MELPNRRIAPSAENPIPQTPDSARSAGRSLNKASLQKQVEGTLLAKGNSLAVEMARSVELSMKVVEEVYV